MKIAQITIISLKENSQTFLRTTLVIKGNIMNANTDTNHIIRELQSPNHWKIMDQRHHLKGFIDGHSGHYLVKKENSQLIYKVTTFKQGIYCLFAN